MIKKIRRGEDLQISLTSGEVISTISIKRAGEGQVAVTIDAPRSVRIDTTNTDKAKTFE